MILQTRFLIRPIQSFLGPSLSFTVFMEKRRIRHQPKPHISLIVLAILHLQAARQWELGDPCASEFVLHILLQPFRDPARTNLSYEVTYELSAGSGSSPVNLYFCAEYSKLSSKSLCYFSIIKIIRKKAGDIMVYKSNSLGCSNNYRYRSNNNLLPGSIRFKSWSGYSIS
jgi:hypothetical protein